jgi:hypothetical protein
MKNYQQVAQYKSPSHPKHLTVASSWQIMHQVSISSSVNFFWMVGVGFSNGLKVGADGRPRLSVFGSGAVLGGEGKGEVDARPRKAAIRAEMSDSKLRDLRAGCEGSGKVEGVDGRDNVGSSLS